MPLAKRKGGGGVNLRPDFQKGGELDRTSVFRGGWWERGCDFFQGGCNFLTKDKLKSGIFNDKKKFINKNSLCCRN